MLALFVSLLCTLLMWKLSINSLFFSERVFFTSLIIQYISVYFIFSNSAKSFTLKKIFHIFTLFFFGVAPLLQFFNHTSFYGARKLLESEYFYCNLLIICIILTFNLCYFLFTLKMKTKKVTKYNRSEINMLSFNNKIKIMLICLLSFFIVFKMNNYNIISMLIRGGEFKDGIDISSTYEMIINNFFKPLSMVCLLYLVIVKNKFSFFDYCIAFIVIITCFPLSMPRFSAAAMYLPLLILLCPFLNKKNNFSLIFILGLLVVFPLLEKFRYFSLDTSLLDLDFQMFLEGHFDSYQSLALVVSENIITDFHQLLGVFLFFIPRSVWASKPIGSGAFLADELSLGWSNISCNYFAEGYINAGLLGVILFTVILAYFLSLLDSLYWNFSIKESSNFFKIGYLISLGLLFFMLRGDLLSSFAFSSAYLLSIFSLSRLLKQ